MRKLSATLLILLALVPVVLAATVPATKVGGAATVRFEAESPGKGKG